MGGGFQALIQVGGDPALVPKAKLWTFPNPGQDPPTPESREWWEPVKGTQPPQGEGQSTEQVTDVNLPIHPTHMHTHMHTLLLLLTVY